MGACHLEPYSEAWVGVPQGDWVERATSKDGTRLAMSMAKLLIENRNGVEQGKQTQNSHRRDEEPMRPTRITSNQKADILYPINRTINSERSSRSSTLSPIAPNAITTLIVMAPSDYTLNSGTVLLYNLGISIPSLNCLRNVFAAQLLRSNPYKFPEVDNHRKVGRRMEE